MTGESEQTIRSYMPDEPVSDYIEYLGAAADAEFKVVRQEFEEKNLDAAGGGGSLWSVAFEAHARITDDALNELHKTMTFVELVGFFDNITNEYGIEGEFEREQASECAYAVDDWREAVSQGYFWQLLGAAIECEMKNSPDAVERDGESEGDTNE